MLVAAGIVLSANHASAAPNYEFGTHERIIDIGYGVFATPMSVLGEVMRRDRILQQQAESASLEFRWHPYEKGVDSLKDIVAGKLDASMPTDVVAISAVAQTDVMLVGYVRQSFATVVGPKSWRMVDLRGKRIGNAAGTSGHNALLHGLDSAGLTESDVTLVQMNVSDMPSALLAGRIDAFSAFEPTPSSVLRQHPIRFGALHKQISPAYFILQRSLSIRNPEGARLLVASLHRAVRWLGRGRDNLTHASQWTLTAMREFSGREPTISEGEIIRFTRQDLLEIAGAPRIPANESESGSALSRNFEFFKKSGMLPAQLSWAKIQSSIDRNIAGQVLKDSRRYRLDEFDYRP